MSTKTNSLIDAVITNLHETSTMDHIVEFAGAVQQTKSKDPVERILLVTTKAYDAREEAGGKRNYSGVKPESALSFIQAICNSSVRTYKFLCQARDKVEEQDAVDGGNGTDYYAERCDDLGIDPLSRQSLAEAIAADFSRLSELHSSFRAAMSYLDARELFQFCQDEKVTDAAGNEFWQPRFEINDIDEAVEAIDTLAKERKSQTQAVWAAIKVPTAA